MKLKLFACLAVGALSAVTHAVAAPISIPFLAVDINGTNASGPAYGPTAAGFQPFNAADGLFLDPSVDWPNSGASGLTNVYSTTLGNVTVNMTGVGLNRGARDRGANAGALSDLYRDFAFAQRDGAIAFGRNYVKLTLSGLTPNQKYEFTGYAREPFNSGPDSFQAWTDIAALGGSDGPSAWLDANVSAGASYQPAPGGVNNTIPHYVRSPTSGPDSADPYAYAATFVTTASAGGVATLYTWADPNSFSGVQGASLLNGFQLGVNVPEPTSLTIFSMGLVGMIFAGRRRLS
jgi:hypothetical protein